MAAALAASLTATIVLVGCGDGHDDGPGGGQQQGQAQDQSQGQQQGQQQDQASGGIDLSGLPDISTFATQPSDQLPADISHADQTSPFLGKNAGNPHQGLHINWSNGDGTWPDGSDPASYPAIYAVADGVVSNVETSRQIGDNNGYGMALTFATDKGQPVMAYYSIEPFTKEPSPGFFAPFVSVKDGQKVTKGDVLAHIYVPPDSTGSTHLHFHLLGPGNRFESPSIFTKEQVAAFAAKFGDRGGRENGTTLPACMGWKLAADENPFGTGAQECL